LKPGSPQDFLVVMSRDQLGDRTSTLGHQNLASAFNGTQDAREPRA
jgi:hypothetical protein